MGPIEGKSVLITGSTSGLGYETARALIAGGAYTHVPVDDDCDRLLTSTFTPGTGNEYYLVVTSGDGREGGAGADSSGTPRPQPSSTCGIRRETCP